MTSFNRPGRRDDDSLPEVEVFYSDGDGNCDEAGWRFEKDGYPYATEEEAVEAGQIAAMEREREREEAARDAYWDQKISEWKESR